MSLDFEDDYGLTSQEHRALRRFCTPRWRDCGLHVSVALALFTCLVFITQSETVGMCDRTFTIVTWPGVVAPVCGWVIGALAYQRFAKQNRLVGAMAYAHLVALALVVASTWGMWTVTERWSCGDPAFERLVEY